MFIINGQIIDTVKVAFWKRDRDRTPCTVTFLIKNDSDRDIVT